MSFNLHLGDSLEILKTLAADSVDAVVTDPPYGFSFMGKKWDYELPSVELWGEVIRVLKPGGHLLGFGGARTYHRAVCRIEDAGFEIRDCVMWVYSQGFPKSLNIGCKCKGSALSYTHGQDDKAAESQAECDVHFVRNTDVSSPLDTSKRRREILQSRLQEQGASTQGATHSDRKNEGREQPGMEGRGDVLAQAWELQANQVREMSDRIPTDGSPGWLHHGAQADNGDAFGTDAGEDGSGASRQPRSARQPNRKPRTVREQLRAQASRRGEEKTCPQCGGLIEWAGWGTALKPAHEPIVLARKPLGEGTVAGNVMKWGTGGINVDGCRINLNGGYKCKANGRPSQTGLNDNYDAATANQPDTLGRWPANFIHDGSDEVEAGFPVTTSGSGDRNGAGKHEFLRGVGDTGVPRVYSIDTGSASRFFKACPPDDARRIIYVPKASRSEREAGLDGTRTVKYNVDKSNILLTEGLSWKDVSTVLAELLRRVTSELTLRWSIGESGESITGQCPSDSLSTTLTAISRITTSQILSLLTHSLINDCIADANCETTNGGNLAASAESSKKYQRTITSESQAELVHGVRLVVSPMLFSISDAENWKPTTNTHSTVKPISLMRYLCRLITPPNGIILDPFMGSGTTGAAAMLEGFNFIGIEREPEYIEIARRRIEHWKDESDEADEKQPELFEMYG